MGGGDGVSNYMHMNRTLMYFVLVVIAVVLTIGLPRHLYSIGLGNEAVAAWGTWAGVLAVALAAILVIPQIGYARRSTDTDVFLKASEIIDDEKTFGRQYHLVVKNAKVLENAFLCADGKALGGIEGENDPDLANAVQDVLSALEQVGIIFHYTANREMLQEYIGDVVVNAHDALSNVIAHVRSEAKDDEMYERFTQMYNYCAERWPKDSAKSVAYTNVSHRQGKPKRGNG